MSVKIRLMRVGKKKQPTYRVVVSDARSPRDGRFLEIIGQYAPRQEPSLVTIDNERALHWLNVGAQPTESAAKLLQILWVCGRLPENWRAIVASLERWGAERGCTEVETGGRFGWARKLAEEGYAAVPWLTLRKEL